VDLGQVRLDERPFEVGEVVLFRSHLKAGGAVYEPLARSRLGPGSGSGSGSKAPSDL
jgi:hypothetical protein